MVQRRTLRIVIVATLLALGVGGVIVTQARATGGAAVTTGRGAWIAGHTDFVGYYRALVHGRWLKVYCISPDRRAPTRIGMRTTRRLPKLSARVTREVAETLSAHGNAQGALQAEAVSQAVNDEVGNHAAVARRAQQLPARARALAARYVAEARTRSAPFHLTLRLPASPLPGQSGRGAVALRGTGTGVAATVQLRHTPNVVTPSTVLLGRSGRASFAYRTVGGGPVHVAATVRVAPATVLVSRADPATQTMVTWTAPATARAAATYEEQGPAFTHRYACTTQCDGHPLVTLTACAPASRFASRITYWYDDAQHVAAFPAARHRTCASWQVTIADGVSVSATWQYRVGRGWTSPLPARGVFVVDCPAAPPVAVLLSYDCTNASLTATLGTARGGSVTPLRNTTRHRMVLVLAGAFAGRFVVQPGAISAAHTLPIACGTHATVTVTGGVQRTSGAFNYGQSATVTTP